jgi:hypothetical protein
MQQHGLASVCVPRELEPVLAVIRATVQHSPRQSLQHLVHASVVGKVLAQLGLELLVLGVIRPRAREGVELGQVTLDRHTHVVLGRQVVKPQLLAAEVQHSAVAKGEHAGQERAVARLVEGGVVVVAGARHARLQLREVLPPVAAQ